LFRVLLGEMATVTSFPLSKHTGGGGAILAFSSWLVYLQFRWEVAFPPSPVGLSSHSHFYKLSRSKVAGQGPPLLVYLQFHEGLPLLPSSVLRAPHPLCYVSLFVVVYSVFFPLFSLGRGQSVQGAIADVAQGCLWEYHMLLSSPGGLRLSSR
jgi:hypothetical protein